MSLVLILGTPVKHDSWAWIRSFCFLFRYFIKLNFNLTLTSSVKTYDISLVFYMSNWVIMFFNFYRNRNISTSSAIFQCQDPATMMWRKPSATFSVLLAWMLLVVWTDLLYLWWKNRGVECQMKWPAVTVFAAIKQPQNGGRILWRTTSNMAATSAEISKTVFLLRRCNIGLTYHRSRSGEWTVQDKLIWKSGKALSSTKTFLSKWSSSDKDESNKKWWTYVCLFVYLSVYI